MLIECLIKRDGPTHVNVAGFEYVFEKNEEGRSVCDVISTGHQAHFLALDSFISYKPRGEKQEELPPEKTREPVPVESTPVWTGEVDVLYRHDGSPYKTEKAAKVAIKQRSLDEDLAAVVQVEDGFAIQLFQYEEDEA